MCEIYLNINILTIQINCDKNSKIILKREMW